MENQPEWDGQSERRRPGRSRRDVIYKLANGDSDMAKWIAIFISFLVAIFAGFGTWVAQAERLKGVETEVIHLKQTREQDLADARRSQKEVKEKVEKIETGVNQILILLKAQDIRERERERDRERR